MATDDPVDTTSLIFTEGDVYMICGYLAEQWGVEKDVTEDTEHAITAILAKVS